MNKTPNKNMILAAAGIALQTIGGICTLVASVRMAKEASRKLKRVIATELSRQLEEKE